MILNIELTKEEKEVLSENFNDFRTTLFKLLRSSELFIEDKKIPGWFNSKSTREHFIGQKLEIKPMIKIECLESYDLSDKFGDDFHTDFQDSCNSFKITWTKIVGKEKISTGIFSTKEVNTYKESNFYPMYLNNEGKEDSYKERQNYNWFLSELKNNEKDICITPGEMDVLNNIFSIIRDLIPNVKIESSKRLTDLINDKTSTLNSFDKDNNGEVDLVDGESFNKLLSKHQKAITEIDKNYIQKFVKISLYLKTKKKNTQKIFETIEDIDNSEELEELSNLLKNQIHTYELLVFHSLSMVTSLIESDLITFYEIYESFDQLGVFNSNWENEVSNKLSDIGDGIKELMYSINSMEDKIVHSLETLTYVTQDSFSDLNNSITSQLGSIDSSIKFNNLLTGIQTYQMYKINKNTKRIN